MDKQTKSVAQLRAERQRAVEAGDQAKVAELDQQIATAQPGGQPNTGESGTAQA